MTIANVVGVILVAAGAFFLRSFLKTLDVVDREKLFLLGGSQGGCAAGITAPRRRDDVRAAES